MSNQHPVVIHVLTYDRHRIGGPWRSVPALISTQRKLGYPVALLALGATNSVQNEGDFPVFSSSSFWQWPEFPAPFDRVQLFHFHALYQFQHACLAFHALRRSIPYMISPRGAMTQGAQNQRRLKKMFGNAIFQNHMVAKANAIHCLTEAEAQDARKWKRPVFVVPNGTDLNVTPRNLALDATDLASTLNLLFLGRLDIYHKGLDLLLKGMAIARKRDSCRRLRLRLVGPDERGDRLVLEKMTQRLGLSDCVSFMGPLTGPEKARAFCWAHVFVHTSRFEGHPLAVLEALAYGLPCILTPGTNMADIVATAGAGWNAGPTAEGIASTLGDVSESQVVLPQMGYAARRLVEREWSLEIIATKMKKQYEMIIGVDG